MPSLMYPLDLNNGSINSSIRFTEFKRISTSSSEIANTINIYMPDDLSCPIDTEWQDSEQIKLFADFAKQASSAIQTVANFIGEAAGKKTSDKIAKGTALVEKVGNIVDAGGALASFGAKTIVNPGTILLFKGVKLREVSMSFKMSPTSQKEASEINNICTAFKAGSLPETQGDAGGVGLLTYPNEYEIEFLYNGQKNPFMPKLKRGVITNCEVTYTDNSFWTMTREGAPSTCTLQLTFKELEIQNRADYEFNAVTVDSYLKLFGNINSDIAGEVTNTLLNNSQNLGDITNLNNIKF